MNVVVDVVFVQRSIQLEILFLKKAKRKDFVKYAIFVWHVCINCPFHAIELRIDKNPDVRYRHQDITLKDIVNANQQGGK